MRSNPVEVKALKKLAQKTRKAAERELLDAIKHSTSLEFYNKMQDMAAAGKVSRFW